MGSGGEGGRRAGSIIVSVALILRSVPIRLFSLMTVRGGNLQGE